VSVRVALAHLLAFEERDMHLVKIQSTKFQGDANFSCV